SPFTWDQAPAVSFTFDKRELKEALQEIADATGVNIVVDSRAGEKGKTLVSATVRDVGVDTAVQLLANMADLTTMPVENVVYVTTQENAKVLRAELLHLEPEKAEEPKARKTELGSLPSESEPHCKEREKQKRRPKDKHKQPNPNP